MKRLSEYTLGEMQKICEAQTECGECPFSSIGCRLSRKWMPSEWELKDKIFFTDEEVETAKALVRCFGSAAWFSKPWNSLGVMVNIVGAPVAMRNQELICPNAFPSLARVEQFSRILLTDVIKNEGIEI